MRHGKFGKSREIPLHPVAPRMPMLSTYLGHVHPRHTYWYLSAKPELLALAAKRLEVSLGAMP